MISSLTDERINGDVPPRPTSPSRGKVLHTKLLESDTPPVAEQVTMTSWSRDDCNNDTMLVPV